MNSIFERSNEKLKQLINKKLNTIDASVTKRQRAEKELLTIEKRGDATVFLLFYELVKYLKKENIYFSS